MNNKEIKIYLDKACNNESNLLDINYKCSNMFYDKSLYGFINLQDRLNDLSRERINIINEYFEECCIKKDEKDEKESFDVNIETIEEYISIYKEALYNCKKYINELASEFLNKKDHCSYAMCITLLKLFMKSCKEFYKLEECIKEYGTSDLAIELINYKLKDTNTNDILS